MSSPGTAYVVEAGAARHRAGRRPLPGRPALYRSLAADAEGARLGDSRLSPRQARPHAADHLARRAADRLAGRRRDDRQHELRAPGAGRGQRSAHPRRVRGHDLHPRGQGDGRGLRQRREAPFPCRPGDPCADRRQARGRRRPGRRGGRRTGGPCPADFRMLKAVGAWPEGRRSGPGSRRDERGMR